jgi:hypothetical protein
MKKHVAMKWIKALRSGKYRQGIGSLQSFDTYCCLGVLCRLAPKSIKVIKDGNRLRGEDLKAQPSVKRWSDMGSYCGWYNFCNLSLADDNDCGRSFEEIADIIEKHWEEL